MDRILIRTIALSVLFLMFSVCHAQRFLNTNVSVSVKNKPVAEVLKLIAEQGEFTFGYNSDIIAGDSIVSLSIQSRPVKEVLDALLTGRYRYKENGDHVIIQRAPTEKYYYITGQVFDAETSKEVDFASVYSKQQLISTLTDDAGFFKLRSRSRNFPVTLTLSKIGYADTAIVINTETDSGIRVTIYPKAIDLDTLVITNEKESSFWLARLFVSSRLRAQSRNISRFFVALPFQMSLTPGLSSHGRLSSQITNKVSVNIYGGYTAGVNGVELGGLFNISKKDARYLQMATTFNAVAGHFTGLQAAGVYNQVLDSLKGVQISGGGGYIKNNLKGVQLSGIFNAVSGNVKGVQFSIGWNLANGDLRGVQISSGGNVVGKDMAGVQISGLFNYAKNLKGFQIGMVNLADTSSGYSLGLFNIVKDGKGAVSVYTDELVPLNIAWKSGSSKLYNVISFGTAVGNTGKAYTFGFGFGREFHLNKTLRLDTEITRHHIYLGTWKNQPALCRFQPGLNVRLGKQWSLTGGPSFSISRSRQNEVRVGYQSFTDKGFFRFNTGDNGKAWFGWHGGLSWNYGLHNY